MIKTFLYAIIYPLAIELFALRKRSMHTNKLNEFECCKRWTTLDRIRGCKKISDHYNATPLLEAIDCPK